MEEGEALSKKQLAQEGTIKKLRAAVREAGEARAALEHTLASDQARLQDALAARAAFEDSRRVSLLFCFGLIAPALLTEVALLSFVHCEHQDASEVC